MASALMRRAVTASAFTGLMLAGAPLIGTAYAAAPAVKSLTPSPTSTNTRPQVKVTYDQALSSGSLSVTDNSDASGANLCGSSSLATNSTANDTLVCQIQTDLTDKHVYTVHGHAVNAKGETTDNNAGTFTEDIPSVASASPANGGSSLGTQFSATFDEPIGSSSTASLVNNANGQNVFLNTPKFSSSSPTKPGNDTITVTPQQSPLPDGNYTITYTAYGTPGLPPTEDKKDYGIAGVTFTVTHAAPVPPTITAAGFQRDSSTGYINNDSTPGDPGFQSAVVITGTATPGNAISVLIRDTGTNKRSANNDPGNTGLGPDDARAATTTDSNGNWRVVVDTTKAGPAGNNTSPDSTSTPALTVAYQAVATATNGTPTPAVSAAFPMVKDTQAPSPAQYTCGGVTPPDCATGPTNSPANDHVHLVMSDNDSSVVDFVTSAVSNGGPTNNSQEFVDARQGSSTTVTADHTITIPDGKITLTLAARDLAGNRSDDGTTDPDVNNPFTKEAVTLAPVSAALTVDGSPVTPALGGSTPPVVHSPSDIGLTFNEPIRKVWTYDVSSNPAKSIQATMCLSDSTGNCATSPLDVSISSDALTLQQHVPSTLPDGTYGISVVRAFAYPQQSCADAPTVGSHPNTSQKCEGYPNSNVEGTTPPAIGQSGVLFTFTVDDTPPAAPSVSVSPSVIDDSNLGTATVSGTAEPGSHLQVSLASSGGGSLILPAVTAGSDGSWSISNFSVGHFGDGVLTASAKATDATGNTGPTGTGTGTLQLRPSVPQNFFVGAGDRKLNLIWSPPAADGGSPITGYLVTVSPGNGESTFFGPTTTATSVGGLSNGTTYTVTVAAINSYSSTLQQAGDPYVGAPASGTGTPRGPSAISLSAPSILTYGQSGTLRGKLTYLGTGLAGEKVVVTPYIGSKAGASKTLTTDSLGNFALSAKPSRTTKYVAAFAGDSAYGAASNNRLVKVRVAIKITKVAASSRSHLATVTLTGYVAPNMHGRTVYIYEVIKHKNVRLAAVKLTSKSTWTYKRKFGKGTHYVFANFRTQNAYYGNNSSKVKFSRS
jgi:hypothetical protein